MNKGNRGLILSFYEQLIREGTVSVSAGRRGTRSLSAVAVCRLRKCGYEVKNIHGVGYTMGAAQREALDKEPWLLAMRQRALGRAVYASVSDETAYALESLAEERGVPLEAIVAKAIEIGTTRLCR